MAALTGNGKRHKRRLRVPGGTHGLREGAKTSHKGVGRLPRATGRGRNVAQGCRTVLTGYGKGRKRRPRVSPVTHRLRKGAKTLLESGRNKMRGGKILSGPRYLCGLELLSRGKDRFLEYSCQVHIWFKLRKFHESLRIIVMIDHFTDSVDFLLGLVFGGLVFGVTPASPAMTCVLSGNVKHETSLKYPHVLYTLVDPHALDAPHKNAFYA